MARARNRLLVAAIAVVGLACATDGGSTGTGGSGGKGGASALGGRGGMGAGGVHEGAGAIGTGGAGAGGSSGGAAGDGGHAGTGGGPGTGGHAASDGAGAGGHAGSAGGAGSGAGAGGHAGSAGGAGGVGGHGGSGGGAGAGGQAGGGGGAGGTKVCGGITGATCSGVGEFCYFGNGQCGAGDQQGHCELAGGALCTQQVVCGCDGNTYSSACMAAANGFDVMGTTSCIPGNGGADDPCGQDTDCMTGYKCCVTGGRAGSPIACRQVAAGQSCPALP